MFTLIVGSSDQQYEPIHTMILSQSCKYGLRASVLLATKETAVYISIRELSDELDISYHFLTKILQKLNTANLLCSKKGLHGGVKLSRRADQITFMDIVDAVDGRCSMDSCALGLPGCGEKRPCPMHEKWSAIKSGLFTMMETVTLAELAMMPVEEWKKLLICQHTADDSEKDKTHDK